MPLTMDPDAHGLQSRIMLIRRPSWNPDIRSHALIIVFGFFSQADVEQLESACLQSHLIPADTYAYFDRPNEVCILTRGFQFPDDRVEEQGDWAGVRQFMGMADRSSSMYQVHVMWHWAQQSGDEGTDPEGRRVVHVQTRLPQTLADSVATQARLVRRYEEEVEHSEVDQGEGGTRDRPS